MWLRAEKSFLIFTPQSHSQIPPGKFLLLRTYNSTINGWLMAERMFFSLSTCSVCFNLKTSVMLSIFSAMYSLFFLSRAKTTRPNVPVPENDNSEKKTITTKISKIHYKNTFIAWKVSGLWQIEFKTKHGCEDSNLLQISGYFFLIVLFPVSFIMYLLEL